MNLISENELYHFNPFHDKLGRFSSGNSSAGVPLRKISRYQYSDGSFTKSGKKKYMHKDGTLNKKGKKYIQKQSELKKDEDVKYRGILSDNELQNKINRLEKEKKLKDITENELHKGRKLVSQVIENSAKAAGTKVLTTAFAGAGLYAIEKAGTGKFNYKEFRKYMVNGGPTSNKNNNKQNKKDVKKSFNEFKKDLNVK